MNTAIRYRHNPGAIRSLEDFLRAHGGYAEGQREVYFLRALGALPNMAAAVQDMDRLGGPTYLRLPEALPKLTSPEDTAFYTGAYEAWRAGGPLRLHLNCRDPLFPQVLAQATEDTLAQYQRVKAGASETILKNFAVKLWHWTDSLLGGLLSQWSPQGSLKVVAENVQKEQSYLFFYLLTLLGCDVLLLNTRGEVQVGDALKKLSAPLALGPYGEHPLPSFAPRVQAASPAPQPIHTPQPTPARATPTLTIPPHPARARRAAPAPAASSGHGAQEKSFEALANLASSIVMITVHGDKGQPIATGSGIMIGRKGFLLTNFHVIRGGRSFSVRIEEDETVYPTDEVIKYNADLDLAVLRIQRELQVLPIYDGRKKLVRGQKVVAIGSPLGLFNSVSDGIISGFRQINDVDMIQFTAPISHGSSGGAVLNMAGELIGISTAGFDQGQNINLAVGYENIRLFARGFYSS